MATQTAKQAALDKLSAKFKDIAPRPGGAWKEDRPLRAVPSGVPSIDYAIGIGGLPRGTLIEIFGEEHAGKTFTALTFAAQAQKMEELVGFVDAEHALQPTFLSLIPDLDVDAMMYSEPRWGEEALDMSKEYIKTGAFGVWAIDSVHACVPKSMAEKPIGDAGASAALASLMSQACQVMDHIIADTNTVAIFINHKKSIPQVQFGRDWYTPGGSALPFYASVRLHIWISRRYFNRDNRQIGHKVKVKVEKNKVAAPYATAEYDLFYGEGRVKGKDKEPDRDVVPGIDIASNWWSVLQQEGRVQWVGSAYVDAATGEKLAKSKAEIMEALADPSSMLVQEAQKIVYPEKYK